METESALQAAAASCGDLKGGKRVKLRLQVDDVIARVGPPDSLRLAKRSKIDGESMIKEEIGVKEEKDVMIVIDSDGDDSSNKVVKNEREGLDSFNSTRCRASKRSRSYKEVDDDDDDDEDVDSSDDFMRDVESPPRSSSSSSSSSSSFFAFPKISSGNPHKNISVTDRWIAVDTTSFSSSFSGLQAMILISSSAEF